MICIPCEPYGVILIEAIIDCKGAVGKLIATGFGSTKVASIDKIKDTMTNILANVGDDVTDATPDEIKQKAELEVELASWLELFNAIRPVLVSFVAADDSDDAAAFAANASVLANSFLPSDKTLFGYTRDVTERLGITKSMALV